MKRSRPISRYDTTEATTGAGSSGNHSSRGGFKGKGKGSKRGEGEGGDTNNNKDNGAKSNKSLKNQIRSLERFIKRDGLSPIIVREKQKQIEKLKSAMTAKVTQENERTMATKYHKVKFFERVKVDRRVKQLKKQIASLMEEDDITSGPAAKKLKKFKQQLNEFRNKAKVSSWSHLGLLPCSCVCVCFVLLRRRTRTTSRLMDHPTIHPSIHPRACARNRPGQALMPTTVYTFLPMYPTAHVTRFVCLTCCIYILYM
jgi:hypothetical protein